jgi:hypothetical protein
LTPVSPPVSSSGVKESSTVPKSPAPAMAAACAARMAAAIPPFMSTTPLP